MEIFSDIIHGIKCGDDTLVEAKELYQKFLDKFEKHPGWEKDNHSLSDHTFKSNILVENNCEKINASISQCLFQYLEMLNHSPKSVEGFAITESWLTHTVEGEYARQHNHGTADVSGVYYIQSNPETDGSIYFLAPETIRTAHPLYRFMHSQHDIEAHENTMILFPGWMPHGTRVHKGDKPRISLSFNIRLGYK